MLHGWWLPDQPESGVVGLLAHEELAAIGRAGMRWAFIPSATREVADALARLAVPRARTEERRVRRDAAPFVDVARHIEDTVGAGSSGVRADRRGIARTALVGVRPRAIPRVAPGIDAAICSARRLLPFFLRGQPPGFARELRKPRDIGKGRFPRD